MEDNRKLFLFNDFLVLPTIANFICKLSIIVENVKHSPV